MTGDSVQYGITAVAVGEIKPYSFTDEKTGELKAGLNLRITGAEVGVAVAPEIVERMVLGEVWEIHGVVTVGSGGKLRIPEPTYLRRRKASGTAGGPEVSFDIPDEPKAPRAVKAS
ncbi:MAG: hypothetical protein AAF726_17890 [Planctomycetota bacterium]